MGKWRVEGSSGVSEGRECWGGSELKGVRRDGEGSRVT